MAIRRNTIGRVPTLAGAWDASYVNPKTGHNGYPQKKRVTHLGSEFESLIEDNTYAPATLNQAGTQITFDTEHWLVISNGTDAYLLQNTVNEKLEEIDDVKDAIEAEQASQRESMATMQNTINAKQLEIGAVQTDPVPTQNSGNHMTSGDIYQTLKDSSKGFVDNVPAPDSDKIAKSGGILNSIIQNGPAFDLSAYNDGEKYADLAEALTALNSLPSAFKRGGMSVKFVQSSDNKYVQLRCKTQAFSTNPEDWYFDGDDTLVDNPEFIEAKTDSEGKVFEARKIDGTKIEYCDVEVKGRFINQEIQNQIASKVDCEENKSLIDSDFASSNESINNTEWLEVTIDLAGKILGGRDKSGNLKEYLGITTPSVISDIVKVKKELKLEPDALENLRAIINNDSVPSYFVENVEQAIGKTITNMSNVGRKGETFIFISDIHWVNNVKNSPKLIKQILSRTNVKDVICTGDLINEGEKSVMASTLINCTKSFAFNGMPLITTRGNHDDNSNWGTPEQVAAHEFDFNEYYSYFMKPMEGLVNYIAGDECSFYYDKQETKTRYIFLDTRRLGYPTENTIPAVCEILNNTEDGWHVIFVYHIYKYSYDSQYPSSTARAISSIVDAYNSRQEVTVEYYIDSIVNNQREIRSTSSDFTNANGSCVAIFAGHNHKDADYTTEGGVPIVLIDTDCRIRTIDTDNPFVPGTITEQAFDIVTIDYENRNIKCVRVGAGRDREFIY